MAGRRDRGGEPSAPPARSLLALLGSGAAAFGVAGVGGVVTTRSLDSWYRRLDKPSWTPPDRVFGPVWSLLYGAQAVAAWLVWRSGGERAPALQLYGAQLALNLGWTLLFFGLRRPGWAVLEIAALWVAIAATIAAFRRRSRAAAWLLLPYLAWVSFAMALTVAVWRRNR
ncbi:MAG TPA: TspO/MBR family protein [Actinomycetota bacterium]|jgi:tryptophan-rich sensory protein|nr:TspO/MBR family protein [Actinomycetota bacterium]